MISLVFADRCTSCGICVRVCPTNVFDVAADGLPLIARQDDCQTCFMCELHCPVDALYVDPDCDNPVTPDAAVVQASDWPSQYRRDSGWGRWRTHSPDESWRMDSIFATARDLLP
jgi:NAD-dependent dihydropyrimidine dehydrogenase PreA subunit